MGRAVMDTRCLGDHSMSVNREAYEALRWENERLKEDCEAAEAEIQRLRTALQYYQERFVRPLGDAGDA